MIKWLTNLFKPKVFDPRTIEQHGFIVGTDVMVNDRYRGKVVVPENDNNSSNCIWVKLDSRSFPSCYDIANVSKITS